MSIFKQIIVVMIAFSMVLSFAACGNGNTGSSSQVSNAVSGTDGLSSGVKEEFSKPKGDTANLMDPQPAGESDTAADAMKAKVRNSADELNITGQKYYVSMNGDDSNSGTSPDKAWKTLKAVNENYPDAGDAVLFERGGVWRGNIEAREGITYGAYGTGDKPCIYGASENAAMSVWQKTDTPNVYVCKNLYYDDVGIIIFNHGEAVGIKCMKSLDEVKENYDFYYNISNQSVYLYLDKGNPADVFYDIEICVKKHIISINNNNNITIDNLCLKYGGAHGIGGAHNKNITVTNCELGWIGGSIQNGETRYGNAIEIWGSCDGFLVQNNYIYQIYDTGITNQFTGPNPDGPIIMQNMTYKENLIEYCCSSIEYFLAQSDSDKAMYKNFLVEGNIMRYAGYGFGKQRTNKTNVYHIAGFTGTNVSENFVIKNNIFDHSKYNIADCRASAESYMPKMSGNTYIQTAGSLFGIWYDTNKRIMYKKGQIEEFIKSIDDNPTVLYREKSEE